MQKDKVGRSEGGNVGKISAAANQALIDQLKELHVRGVLTQLAERGQLLELKCEMPKCFCSRGRKAFDSKTHPPTDWAPSADHYPIPKALGGELRPGTYAWDTSSATVWTTDGGLGSSRYSSASTCRSRRSPRI